MKLSLALLAVVLLAACTASPTGPQQPEAGVRLRRATCDLLSISTPIGSLNHAACAAHCLAMRRGYRGGRCRDGVCHCRS
ncbi:holotricin-1 [Bacillus rossius redtenbacheri]|uniref:holotricin-1 n=1 Tax=Bacillus rossius redtenbacheri TaxID=93214 RepID=UPI002FDD461F